MLAPVPPMLPGGLVCPPMTKGAGEMAHCPSSVLPFSSAPMSLMPTIPPSPNSPSCPQSPPAGSTWTFFAASQNTGPNHKRLFHSCDLSGFGNITYTGDSHYVSGVKPGRTLPIAPPYGTPTPNKGCQFPHHNLSFCDTSLSHATRATLLSKMLTPEVHHWRVFLDRSQPPSPPVVVVVVPCETSTS